MDHQAVISPLCTVHVCLNGGNCQDCQAVLSRIAAGKHLGCAAANMGLHILVWARVSQFSLTRLIILSRPLRK